MRIENKNISWILFGLKTIMSVPFYSTGSIKRTGLSLFVILPYLSIFPYEIAKQMEEINQLSPIFFLEFFGTSKPFYIYSHLLR